MEKEDDEGNDGAPGAWVLYEAGMAALGQNYLGPPLKGGIDPPIFFHFLAL